MSAEMAFGLFLLVAVLAVLLASLRPKKSGGDSAMTAEVIEKLSRDSLWGNNHIDVKTFDGVVILGGTVREYDQAKRAIEIAGQVKGVKSVENRMAIRSGQ